MKKTGKLLILLLILSICLTISNFVLAQEIELKVCLAGYPAESLEFFNEFEKEYQQEHPNVHFKIIETDWGTFHDRIGIWIRGKEDPDVYSTSLAQFVSSQGIGAYLCLDDLIDEKLKNVIPEKFLNVCNVDGKQYGIPATGVTFSFWYNKEIFEKAGLDPDKPPKDWNELLDYAQKITENTDAYGVGLNLGRPEDITQLLFGNVYYSATNEPFVDNRGRALFNSPEGIKAVQFIVDLVNKYKVTQPYPEENTKGDIRLLFRDGKIGMTFDGPWIIKYLQEVTDMSSPESSKFAVAAPPASTIEGKEAMVCGGSDPWVISSNTKYPEIAKDVLKKLLTTKWAYKHDIAINQNPYRKDVMEEYKYDQQWIWDVMLKDMDHSFVQAHPVPPPVSIIQVFRILNEYVLKAVFEEMSVKEAMDKAAEEVNKLFGV